MEERVLVDMEERVLVDMEESCLSMWRSGSDPETRAITLIVREGSVQVVLSWRGHHARRGAASARAAAVIASVTVRGRHLARAAHATHLGARLGQALDRDHPLVLTDAHDLHALRVASRL